MKVYVAEKWDDEYGCPGEAVGVASTFQGALDILMNYERKEFEISENGILSQKIIPYGDGSNNKYVRFEEEGGFFSREYSIREFELKMPEEHHDCLNCSASMSDDDENGNMILRCAEHDGKIVDENDCCDEWN